MTKVKKENKSSEFIKPISKVKKKKKSKLLDGKNEKKILSSFHFTNKDASYSSPQKLYESFNKTVSLAKIKKALSKDDTYTTQRNIRRDFKRLKVIAPFIDYQYDMDTANMIFYVDNNDYKHILFIIDIFSRFLWTFKLRSLKGNEMKIVLENFLSDHKPMKVRTDGGSEFVNKYVKSVFNDFNVEHIITKNDPKANYAERVIRSIKDKLGKYMEHNQTGRWVDVLPDMTKSYNHTMHRSIGMRPISVTKENEKDLWIKLFLSTKQKIKRERPPKTRRINFKFKIGDTVRLSTYKQAFDKTSFSHRWTTEIFTIDERYITQGIPQYKVKDYSGEDITGSFYESELQKVTIDEDKEYRIEKILKKRKTKDGKLEYFVKFKGWNKKYNAWVENIKDISK